MFLMFTGCEIIVSLLKRRDLHGEVRFQLFELSVHINAVTNHYLHLIADCTVL